VVEPETWGARLRSLVTLRYFVETWAESDLRADVARKARRDAGLGPDWRPFAVLALMACVLTALEYVGSTSWFYEAMREWAQDDPEWRSVLDSEKLTAWYGKLWWGAWRVGGYVLVPALFVKLVLKEKVSDQFLTTKGFREHAWIYVVAASLVVVLVGIVSFFPSFQAKYPMYHYARDSWSDLLAWEAVYCAQFFALEFFFRGVWMKTLEPHMGSFAVASMIVPYCMIHYGKPWPETIGAIFAGMALGTLALRSRSIWAGFLVHVTVAVTMDLAGLLQTTGLPERW